MNHPSAFTITCVTCGSRLKVGNRNLIGSIDSCPKCGAMVQIIAPEEQLPAADQVAVGESESIDTGAITQSAVDGMDALAPQHNAVLPSPPPQDVALPSPPPSLSTATDADSYRREVDGMWQSQSTQRSKQMALIGLLSLFGLIAAAVVFSQFVRTWRNQETAAVLPRTAVPDAAEQQNDPVDAASSPLAIAAPETATTAPEPAASTPESAASAPKPITPAVEPGTPVVDVPPANLPTEQPIDEAAVTAPAAAIPPVTTGVPPSVPALADMQATTSINSDATAGNGSTTSDGLAPTDGSPPPLNQLPPGLMKFTPLLSLSTSQTPTAGLVPPPPTIDTVRIEDAAVEEEPDLEALSLRKAVDVEKVFAQRYAIGNGGASIADLMLVISQLTTVPIEIDLIALDAAGIRVEAPIKTPAGWMSVREWIDKTCASVGLVSRTEADRVIISASDERIDAGISAALQLDDFGDQAATTFEWLSPLLLEEEPVVAGDGEAVEAPILTALSGDGTAIIPAPSLRSRIRAALAVEAVRMMRGMPARMDRWRTSRWIGPWPAEGTAIDGASFGDWPLVTDGTGGTPLDSPRAAAGLLRKIASLNESNILVGWYDATRQGLYPADPVMPYSREMTAAGMLDEMLSEQGLQTRICGPSLWYVCSEARYDRFEVITWYTIEPGTGAEIVQRIAKSLGVTDLSTLPVAFDDKHLVVRSPRFLARQIPRFIKH